METEKQTLATLATKLRKLIEKEPKTKEDLESWYQAAKMFETEVAPIDNDRLPHFVDHYLSDADIRLKDVAYRKEQEKRIWAIIHALERGEVPDYHQA